MAMTAHEARYAALREMCGIEQQKENCRDMRRVAFFETLTQDLRYAVAQRTNEFGVRVALGAKQSDVVRLALGESFWMVFACVTAGISASLALTRFLSDLLFGVTPTDPTTLFVAIALMTAVALLAGYLHARRASRVDPMIALRHD